jgi:hypothetical protein
MMDIKEMSVDSNRIAMAARLRVSPYLVHPHAGSASDRHNQEEGYVIGIGLIFGKLLMGQCSIISRASEGWQGPC